MTPTTSYFSPPAYRNYSKYFHLSSENDGQRMRLEFNILGTNYLSRRDITENKMLRIYSNFINKVSGYMHLTGFVPSGEISNKKISFDLSSLPISLRESLNEDVRSINSDLKEADFNFYTDPIVRAYFHAAKELAKLLAPDADRIVSLLDNLRLDFPGRPIIIIQYEKNVHNYFNKLKIRIPWNNLLFFVNPHNISVNSHNISEFEKLSLLFQQCPEFQSNGERVICLGEIATILGPFLCDDEYQTFKRQIISECFTEEHLETNQIEHKFHETLEQVFQDDFKCVSNKDEIAVFNSNWALVLSNKKNIELDKLDKHYVPSLAILAYASSHDHSGSVETNNDYLGRNNHLTIAFQRNDISDNERYAISLKCLAEIIRLSNISRHSSVLTLVVKLSEWQYQSRWRYKYDNIQIRCSGINVGFQFNKIKNPEKTASWLSNIADEMLYQSTLAKENPFLNEPYLLENRASLIIHMEDIRESYLQAIVAILDDKVISGTGFLVKHEMQDFLITCAHVIRGKREGESVRLRYYYNDGTPSNFERNAVVVWNNAPDNTDKETWSGEQDTAVLKIIEPLPRSGLSLRGYEVGENVEVYGFGAKYGHRGGFLKGLTVQGTVSGFVELLQTDSEKISKGMSGAPLKAQDNKIVGMVQSFESTEKLSERCYMIRSETILAILAKIEKN